MAANIVDIFFYGLFMDPETLRGKGLDPREPRKASVSHMALQIGDRATLVRREGAVVHGVVMQLTAAELETLYSEASVAAYRAETVAVNFAGGGVAPVLCYNLPPELHRGKANPDYAAKLRAVAGRMGLPESYIRSIG